MILTLKDTNSQEVAARLVEQRENVGAGALGRVLTLLVVVPATIDVDQAIEISESASREHPCRVIVVVDSADQSGSPRLNAQIRVGDSAGVSEVVVLEPHGPVADALDVLVLPLLAADTPVVAYWPHEAPVNPGQHPLGRLAIRRITDSRATDCPVATLRDLAEVYSPGDTDLAWSGVTLWRALLSAVVKTLPAPITSIRVRGNATHPSSYLVALWMQRMLGVSVHHEVDPEAHTITGVFFECEDGVSAALTRSATSQVAHLVRSDLAAAEVNLPRRSIQDCLMEELRRLDPDIFYGSIITQDLMSYPPVAEQIECARQDQ
ncbi:MAG: glucose-6-phosphate dehydrogenase assembly protein OpcA [Actinomycetaceae bacterium]|nr:glucose-6-phosphate dehydrogenase assembly protein OpcA [Actinomycetaceae bacterium]